MAILQFIRFPNLVIVALTQYLLYYLVLLASFKPNEVSPTLGHEHFALFVFITMIITAGGYIINDIQDYDIDRINKPHKILLGKKVSFQLAHWLYYSLNLVGFIFAFYMALHVKNIKLVWLFPLSVAGLYWYSIRLKKELLVGNLLVSFYCAGVALILLLAEKPSLLELKELAPAQVETIFALFWWYGWFAFLSTWFREIIKDMEDVKGDIAEDCRTLPIRWGMFTSKLIAMAIALGLIFSSLFWGFKLGTFFLGIVIFFVAVPVLIALFLLWRAQEKKAFHQLSQLAKFIMLAGILLILFISQTNIL